MKTTGIEEVLVRSKRRSSFREPRRNPISGHKHLALKRRDRERNSTVPEVLRELARLCGIETAYVDMAGRHQEASPDTLREILRIWGLEAGTAKTAREAIRSQEERRWREVLPPVAVCWEAKPRMITVRVPAQAGTAEASCKLHYQDGRCRSLDWIPQRLRATAAAQINGRRYVALQLPLPSLPFGYHHLEIDLGGRLSRAMLISAPGRSYSPERRRSGWGTFVPWYALHSESSWGAGNFGDAKRLAAWTASLGGSAIGTLPLLSGFLDKPFSEPSPYSPASRLFWNEFYLDIEELPEFQACDRAQKLVRSPAFLTKLISFRACRLIDYQAQMSLRRQVLELLADFFFTNGSTTRRQGFEAFLQHRKAAADYAEFRAACEQHACSWTAWEERLRNGKLQQGDYAEAAKRYHLYVQWAAEEQVAGLARSCHERDLCLQVDLPVGVHPGGYDVWRHRDLFALPADAGAPPDMFFPNGQNWGFPPLHPDRLRRRGYAYWLDLLRFQMRHAGALRLDHIPGLHRLYWIPPGAPASMGAYVRYPADEFHAILSLESHRHQTIVIGENLGTVPPEVNEMMKRHRFRQTYVVQYEARAETKSALSWPPADSVASLNTHDMPPFAAHWSGRDIPERVRLKTLPEQREAIEKKRRKAVNSALVRFLRNKRFLKAANPDEREVLRAVLEWLACSPAELVLVNLEDLWAEEEWQNMPGSAGEHPNWRRKTRPSLEEIESADGLAELLGHISEFRGRPAEQLRPAKWPAKPTCLDPG